jgi:hypothetical protein
MLPLLITQKVINLFEPFHEKIGMKCFRKLVNSFCQLPGFQVESHSELIFSLLFTFYIYLFIIIYLFFSFLFFKENKIQDER